MRKLFIFLSLAFTSILLTGCDGLLDQVQTATTIAALQGNDTVEINTTWTDPGAKLYVGTTEYIATTTDTVDTTTLGLYEIDYGYEYAGENYTVTRYVIVVDQTPPTLELEAGIDTLKVGTTWTDEGAKVVDNSLETLTIIVTGTVDTSTIGTYTITYTATDSSGNTASIVRYVDVIE